MHAVDSNDEKELDEMMNNLSLDIWRRLKDFCTRGWKRPQLAM